MGMKSRVTFDNNFERNLAEEVRRKVQPQVNAEFQRRVRAVNEAHKGDDVEVVYRALVAELSGMGAVPNEDNLREVAAEISAGKAY